VVGWCGFGGGGEERTVSTFPKVRGSLLWGGNPRDPDRGKRVSPPRLQGKEAFESRKGKGGRGTSVIKNPASRESQCGAVGKKRKAHIRGKRGERRTKGYP